MITFLKHCVVSLMSAVVIGFICIKCTKGSDGKELAISSKSYLWACRIFFQAGQKLRQLIIEGNEKAADKTPKETEADHKDNESNSDSYSTKNDCNSNGEWEDINIGSNNAQMRCGFEDGWKSIETKWIDDSEAVWTEMRTKDDKTMYREMHTETNYAILLQHLQRGEYNKFDICLIYDCKHVIETYEHFGPDHKKPNGIIPLFKETITFLREKKYMQAIEKTLYLTDYIKDIRGLLEMLKPQLPDIYFEILETSLKFTQNS